MRRFGRCVAVLIMAWPLASRTTSSIAASAYKLPVPSGQAIYVTLGQNERDHSAENGSQWAFDFAMADHRAFPIVAARGGTVLYVRSDSTIRCRGLDEKDDGTYLPGCWTQANFVLIGHDDGSADLYLHIAPGSIGVTAGQTVRQGQPLAIAGQTGWASGIHLHFQIETLPCAASDPSRAAWCRQQPGWWWTQSEPVSFADGHVLKKNLDGVPDSKNGNNPYISDNTAPHTTPFQGTTTASDLYPIVENGKWGYINRAGRVVIAPQFEALYLDYPRGFQGSRFSQGLAPVLIGDKWGYIDRTGRVAIPPRFEFATSFSDGLARAMQNDRWGYIDTHGRFVIRPQFTADVTADYTGYDFASDFSEGLALATNDGRNWSYIDTSGRYVIPPRFAGQSSFVEGLALVDLPNGHTAYINKAGKVMLDLGADATGTPFSDGLALILKNGHWYYINRLGHAIIKLTPIDWTLDIFSEGRADVTIKNRCGYINTSGMLVIPVQFSHCSPFRHGLAWVRAGSQWGYIDKSGVYVWRQSGSQPPVKAFAAYVDAHADGMSYGVIYSKPNLLSPVESRIPNGGGVMVPPLFSGDVPYEPQLVVGPDGQSLQVAYGNGWLQVIHDGQTGYMLESQLRRYPLQGTVVPAHLGLQGIEQRVVAVYRQAQTYRFHMFDLNNGRQMFRKGDVNIKQGASYLNPDGSVSSYDIGTYEYFQMNGIWVSRDNREIFIDGLNYIVQDQFTGEQTTPSAPWTLQGTEVVNGKLQYVLRKDNPGVGGPPESEVVWVDAETFLPVKETDKSATVSTEIDYTDWGAPITIQLPENIVAALTPQPSDPLLTMYVSANGRGIDLYTRPSEQAVNLVHIPDGATVVTEPHPIDTHDNNLWYKVAYQGQTGYVLAWYLRLSTSQ